MRIDAEISANRFFPQFDAVEYKTQLCAGTVYFVKVGGAMTEFCYSGVCLLKTVKNLPLYIFSFFFFALFCF